MTFIKIIVEGASEESFVNEVLVKHFASLNIFISARKIKTGWDKINNKPSKGGINHYLKFRNDVLRWIASDKKQDDSWYTSMIDLYSFPVDDSSPYSSRIRLISDPYQKISELEKAISSDIGHSKFIPYVQLHEFEALVLVNPEKLVTIYPDHHSCIQHLKQEIGSRNPEEINESRQTAPSKRIIKYIPDYEKLKAHVGPLVVEDIGLHTLRQRCRHFNEWITKLEKLK
jgi:hypothetical protein